MNARDVRETMAAATAETGAAVVDDEAIHARRRSRQVMLLRVLTGIAILAAWELGSGRIVSDFFMSRPSAIGVRLWEWVRNGSLLFHFSITLQEMLAGFVIGAAAGVVVGFVLGRAELLARTLDPYITAVYSLPKVALAPLFILWLGIGMVMKVVLAAVIVFFLVFYNTFAGVRSVDPDLIDTMRLMRARPWQIMAKLIWPAATPWILTGFKVAVPYALIGAIVGEVIASNRGLGYLVQYSSSQFDTPGVFAALFVLTVIAATLNAGVGWLERRLLRWRITSR